MIWRFKTNQVEFPRPTLVMGVLNVTPDSFSDGGRFIDTDRAVEQALRLVEEGADIVDVGGESTRPRAASVSETEELARVIPVLEKLAAQVSVPISIDTRKPAVARHALEAGASIVNDVQANRDDPAMWQAIAAAEAGYIAMHMQGTPETMQLEPRYDDVVDELNRFFSDRIDHLINAGVNPEQVVLDVGIGFGKTVDHNLELLARINTFTRFKRPLLIGVSRKSFIGKLFGAGVNARLPAGLACAIWAVQAGVQIVRTHDVGATWQALRMLEAILARTNA